MQVAIGNHANAVVAAVSGRIDTTTAPEFDERLQSVPAGGHLILDLHEATYVSSAGLRAVLAAAKRAKASGGKVELAGLNGGVREVFELSGFLSIFTTHESVAAALKE